MADEHGSGSGSIEVTVNNAAPAASITGAPSDDDEGTAISLGSDVTDPDGPFTYDWQVTASNGQAIADGSDDGFDFTPDNNGTYVVTLTVTDSYGETGTDSQTITVDNVAPTATLDGAGSVTQGSEYTLGVSISDPGKDTVTSLDIDWGDGSNGTINVIPPPSTWDSVPFAHVYWKTGPMTITVTSLTDEDGTYTVSATEHITVNGLALDSITVTAGDGVSVTANSSTIPDLFLEEQEGGNSVTLQGTFGSMPNDWLNRVLWQVSGSTATPASETFSYDGDILLTINPDRDFTIAAGVDLNDNGQLDGNEITRRVNVHLVKVESVSLIDSSKPDRVFTLTEPGGYDVFIAEESTGQADIDLNASIVTGDADGRNHVIWKVVGEAASPATGDFLGHNHATLMVTGSNRTYWVYAGFDTNNDGALSPDEYEYTFGVHVLLIDLRAKTIEANVATGNLPNEREETDGAYVLVNRDDDDANNPTDRSDKDRSRLATAENDLLPLVLKGSPGMGGVGSYMLVYDPTIFRVWTDAGAVVAPNTPIEVLETDRVYRVEGLAGKTGTIKVSWTDGSTDITDADVIKVTSILWTGPQNVINYGTFTYRAWDTPSGAAWSVADCAEGEVLGQYLDPSGQALTGKVQWGDGPRVDQLALNLNSDYSWNIEAYVVKITATPGKITKATGPARVMRRVGGGYVPVPDNQMPFGDTPVFLQAPLQQAI